MKILVVTLLSSPLLLAYHLRPQECQQALMQMLHYLLLHLAH